MKLASELRPDECFIFTRFERVQVRFRNDSGQLSMSVVGGDVIDLWFGETDQLPTSMMDQLCAEYLRQGYCCTFYSPYEPDREYLIQDLHEDHW